MQLKFIYEGGASKRYHTVDTHIKQDIAQHSFGVAWLCEYFTEETASKNLIMAALAHDLAEHKVGDIPSPAKRALGIGKMFDEFEQRYMDEAGIPRYELTAEEEIILKYADITDGLLFCLRERTLGNQHVDIIFDRFFNYAVQLEEAGIESQAFELAARTIDNIVDRWEEVCQA